MKNILIALVVLLTVSSCFLKKKDAVAPDFAGTYKISSYVSSGTEFITGGNSGTFVVTRPSDTQINFTLTLIGGGQSGTSNLSATIRKATGFDYDVLNTAGTRIGLINGTDFNFSTATLTVTSKK
jgi:hypothetical protein